MVPLDSVVRIPHDETSVGIGTLAENTAGKICSTLPRDRRAWLAKHERHCGSCLEFKQQFDNVILLWMNPFRLIA